MTPKYKIGDIVKTSAEANGWGSDFRVNNQTLRIINVTPDTVSSGGAKYTFEGGLQTREMEIVGLVSNAGPWRYRFKVGDKVVRRTRWGWASGPNQFDKDHQNHLDVTPGHACLIVEAWLGRESIVGSERMLGYIVESLTGERGSFAEDQLDYFENPDQRPYKKSVDEIKLNKLRNLKELYLNSSSSTENGDYSIIESYIESVLNGQPIGKGDLQWCNELYRKLKKY